MPFEAKTMHRFILTGTQLPSCLVKSAKINISMDPMTYRVDRTLEVDFHDTLNSKALMFIEGTNNEDDSFALGDIEIQFLDKEGEMQSYTKIINPFVLNYQYKYDYTSSEASTINVVFTFEKCETFPCDLKPVDSPLQA